MVRSKVPVVRAFISYAHTDRVYAGQVRQVLAQVGIESFLAHEDLETSEEWKHRILDELALCDLFVPVLSQHFLRSLWAPQEAGFVVSRHSVVIAPLSVDGTIPFGFLSHLQAGRVGPEGVNRQLLVEPLAKMFPRTILPGLIGIAVKASNFRDAEEKWRPLAAHTALLSPQEVQTLASGAASNSQVWAAARCRDEYIPEFIQTHREHIEPETLRALEYQVEHGTWYSGRQPSET